MAIGDDIAFEHYSPDFRICGDPNCSMCTSYKRAKAKVEEELKPALQRMIKAQLDGQQEIPVAKYGKTLRKLLREEMGEDTTDEAIDAVVDVIFDWLQRLERNGNISMASYWRDAAESNREVENRKGIGQ